MVFPASLISGRQGLVLFSVLESSSPPSYSPPRTSFRSLCHLVFSGWSPIDSPCLHFLTLFVFERQGSFSPIWSVPVLFHILCVFKTSLFSNHSPRIFTPRCINGFLLDALCPGILTFFWQPGGFPVQSDPSLHHHHTSPSFFFQAANFPLGKRADPFSPLVTPCIPPPKPEQATNLSAFFPASSPLPFIDEFLNTFQLLLFSFNLTRSDRHIIFFSLFHFVNISLLSASLSRLHQFH